MVPEDFCIIGSSATEQLFGVCESMWRPDLVQHSLKKSNAKEPDDLFEVISQCILSAVDRDALSGWGAIVHVM